MRIAHVVCTFPPYYGGMGNVAFQIASRLIDRGHEVQVITPQYGDFPDEDTFSYAVRLTPSISYGNAAILPDILRELDQFDLIHLHYPFFGTAGLVRRFKHRHPDKPLVVTYHMDARAGGLKGCFFGLYAKFWMPRILASADILHVSSFDYIQASDAADIYAADPNKWRAIPFGVDIERFQPREYPKQLFREHGLDIRKPTIIFVGGMDEAHYFKGIPQLLKALRQVHDAALDVQAVFVGDGSLRAKFQAQAAGLRLEGSVRFVGKVSNELLPYYYNMADLSILPSTTKAEAFGMVLLEAMASGVPVIASDLPGVRTLARDGGVTIPPNDVAALAKAIQDYFSSSVEHRQEKSRGVRTLVEDTYSWDKVMDDIEKMYAEVAK